ncbi:MAG: bifunctional phosphopantothenoylcysteine decarboxylase/phosphopantothenate--cysteine ligase CoaBC, partial [Deltaproteobacteria bacterium]|nr:bifunctional phosphopantothenoylcysteine decarboxylase/phosphopantothenate--cysteine ligase CoaBC [Deltaproteobacteria bacterium]
CELTRLLVKEGAAVYPVMTKSATEFRTPMTLSALSSNETGYDMFNSGRISHIDLTDSADLIVVAPATANIIGKIAGGIADDLPTSLIMAANQPVILAPAMNTRMYKNEIVQENMRKLSALGYGFIDPGTGELACGWEGTGRLAEPEDIVEAIRESLSEKDLAGEKVLVTAGATREPIDPVRFLSNASSGKMGYAIARAAKRRGAEVVLVSGTSTLRKPPGVDLVKVETSEEMHGSVASHYPQSTVVIMAAAVSDFRPLNVSKKKIKKIAAELELKLERAPDILKGLGEKKSSQILVGFALESSELIENATKKLKSKNLDMVVANTPAALSKETNEVTFILSDGRAEPQKDLPKAEVADKILNRVVSIRSKRS